jgi:GT2 family glycosyltransferase
MKSIPVLGSLLLTGVEWIEKQLKSIDYPVDNYVLFNNSGKLETKKQLEILFEKPHPFIKNKTVCHLPSNLGISGGWNLIIKSYMLAPYWIIVNHDVSFAEGLLEEMNEAAQDPEIGMVFPNAGDFGWGSYDLFLLKDWVVQNVGLFDESFYPAYCEDFDYAIRVKNKSIKTTAGLKRPYYHGDTFDYTVSGKQTSKSSPSLNESLWESNVINNSHLLKKWGRCRLTDGKKEYSDISPYTSAYNLLRIDEKTDERRAKKIKACADNYHLLGASSFNLEFARSKHLGDF